MLTILPIFELYYSKIPMRELVKDPKWQKIRITLKGNWKNNPEWCCKQIKKYINNDFDSASNNQIRILMNYVTASGFRIGIINHNCVKQIRKKLSNQIKKRKLENTWY